MNKQWNDVKDFHKAFNHPHSDKPVLLDVERVKARTAWMKEEIDEFNEATTLDGQADAMIDLIYFALGTMVEMGVQPDALFNIVHEANMSKLWEDGKPRYREDGKVIKPATWVAPEPKLREALKDMLNP